MSQTAQPADITAVTNILKDVYTSDRIESQIYDEALLLSQIESTTEYHDAVGNQAVGFVKTGRNVGVSSRSLNGGTLGAAGHQQTNRWTLDYTASYIQIKVLGTTIAKMATARQAAVRAVTLEVDGAIVDLKKDLQRQLYSNGDGLIVKTAASGPSTTVTLLATASTDAQDSNDVLVRGWLQAGEYVDIGTAASEASVVADAKISSITQSDSAPTLVLDSSVTTTTSPQTYISKSDNRSGTTSYESNGLKNMVLDSGSFAGISASSVPEWKSKVKDASGAALSRANMQEVWRGIAQFGQSPDLIVTSLEQQEHYYNLLQAQVRFASDGSLASGQVDGPVFNKIPVAADPDCQRRLMYFLRKDKLFRVSAGDVAWQNQTTGGDVLAWKQDEDAYVARAASYSNLGTENRRAHGVLLGLAV